MNGRAGIRTAENGLKFLVILAKPLKLMWAIAASTAFLMGTAAPHAHADAVAYPVNVTVRPGYSFLKIGLVSAVTQHFERLGVLSGGECWSCGAHFTYFRQKLQICLRVVNPSGTVSGKRRYRGDGRFVRPGEGLAVYANRSHAHGRDQL